MTRNCGSRPSKHGEQLLSFVSAGFFLILAGTIFIIASNLFGSILDFLEDITLGPVPHMGISLPVPATPEAHLTLYGGAGTFCLAWGLFQIFMLALRFIIRSPTGRNAEALSGAVYWIGSAYLIQILLIETTRWFEYWAAIIMLLGASVIARGILLAASKESRSA